MKTERDELKDELVKARAECESAHTVINTLKDINKVQMDALNDKDARLSKANMRFIEAQKEGSGNKWSKRSWKCEG